MVMFVNARELGLDIFGDESGDGWPREPLPKLSTSPPRPYRSRRRKQVRTISLTVSPAVAEAQAPVSTSPPRPLTVGRRIDKHS